MKSYTIDAANVCYITNPDRGAFGLTLTLLLIGISTITFIITDHSTGPARGQKESLIHRTASKLNNVALVLLTKFNLITN